MKYRTQAESILEKISNRDMKRWVVLEALQLQKGASGYVDVLVVLTSRWKSDGFETQSPPSQSTVRQGKSILSLFRAFYFNLIYVTPFIKRTTLLCQKEAVQDLWPLPRKNNPVAVSHMICGTAMHFSQKLCLQK